MMKIITTARVYDRKTGEYIQREVECPISDELGLALRKEINGGGRCKAIGRGHGDDDSNLDLSTPLRDQERFHVDPALHIVHVDEKGNETSIGGWVLC